MKTKPIITAAEAAAQVRDGDTVASSGFVSSAIPEGLIKALKNRFLETGKPNGITYFYAGSQGMRDGSGGDNMAHKGLTKRAIAGHYNTAPALGDAILRGDIEGYNLPQGVLAQLTRDMAARRPGTLTHVGLGTYVDPRLGGGKCNDITTEDMVKLVEIGGEERLLYKSFDINVAFIRGSYADEMGNVTMHREIGEGEVTALAQTAKNSGGKVFVQVEKVVPFGTLDPRLVKIPRNLVDALVIADPKDHEQTYGCEFDPSLTGEARAELSALAPAPLDAKKVIARRGALELKEDSLVNLGIGIPEFVAAVANEEGIGDSIMLTVEAGPNGGMPLSGARFGAAINPECIFAQHVQFDYYDGGGIDMAYLGMAQADESGNINVSRFSGRLAGCGGFINITQNAKSVYFCGTFTSGGFKAEVGDGRIDILSEGREKKFLSHVEQITFSGAYAQKKGQPVLYITERAVFELRKDGVWLTEIAPGVDLEKQVLAYMDFVPKMEAGGPGLMDGRIFHDRPMGLG
ncbi:MAG: 3-oxoacid CoA-transferase [Clostridiales bacterium]|nr:3-oxoacid CoA-transferase [Clostridiales bacterium]